MTAARVPTRRRAATRGQAMIIFALVALVLFAVVGLAVDAGMSYLRNNSEERAAAAAALSGVPYLPDDFTSAQNAAWTEAARNGFRDGATLNGHPVSVTASQPAGTRNELTVTVSMWVPTTFLNLVGFGAHQVTASATAVYLRPITLGQPGNQLGSDLSSLGSGGSNYYFVRTEGWGNPRSEGDGLTPYPTFAGSSTQCSPYTSCASGPSPNVDVHQISALSGTDTADATLPDRGGYNYLVWVPAGTSISLQVFNPAFAPDSSSASNAYGYSYHEYDGSYTPGSTNRADYSTMQYTVFRVNNLFDYTQDTELSKVAWYPFDARHLDDGSNPVSYSYWGSSSTESTVTGTTPAIFHAWTDVTAYSPAASDTALVARNTTYGALSGGAGGQYYRLRVDTLAGDGTNPNDAGTTGSFAHKGYAVRALLSGSGAACSGCTVGAVGDMCFYTPVRGSQATSFQIPFFEVPPEYRGQILTIDVFDPGDVGGGAAYLKIIQPAYGSKPAQAATVTTTGTSGTTGVEDLGPGILGPGPVRNITPVSGGQAYVQTASSSGGSMYNGQWLQFTIQVPGDYNPSAGVNDAGYYWNLEYDVASSATAGDTLTAKVAFQGTPVHLVP